MTTALQFDIQHPFQADDLLVRVNRLNGLPARILALTFIGLLAGAAAIGSFYVLVSSETLSASAQLSLATLLAFPLLASALVAIYAHGYYQKTKHALSTASPDAVTSLEQYLDVSPLSAQYLQAIRGQKRPMIRLELECLTRQVFSDLESSEAAA